MSLRRMMLFTLGAKIKSLVLAFKTRVLGDLGQFEAETCLETQLTQLDNQSVLDNASLIVTPNAYKENLLYSVVPNTTIGDMTVTRATTGTRVNSNSDIEQVPYNILQRSEEFENGIWTKTAVSITANTQTSPIGDLTADTIRIGVDASPVRHRFFQQLTFPPKTRYCASYYLKKANHRWIQLNYVLADFGGEFWANFDLQNGVIGNTGIGAVATITDVGNGWYRCTLLGTTNVGGALTGCEIVTTNNTNSVRYPSYQSTVAEDICYVWGAQLVIDTQPKDYFPTTNRFNVPRLDYSNGSCPNILVEPQSTNQIRNNTMTGAVVGNPGTLPTNWTESLAGLSRQIIGVGVEKGIQYLDIRYSGTATNVNQRIIFEPATQIVATNAQTWTLSTYFKLTSTPQPPTNISLLIFELTSLGVFVAFGSQIITATTSFARYSFTRTLSGGATVARVQPIINFSTVIGQTYDFTIRVYGPQMEQLSNVTSLMQTTSATVTRNADVISNINAITLIGQTEGTVFIDFSNITNALTLFSLSNNGVNARLIPYRSGSNLILFFQNNLGIVVYSNTITNFFLTSFTSGIRFCFTYNSTTHKYFVNGLLIASIPASLTNTTFSKINIGSFQNDGTVSNYNVKTFSLWKTAITDTQAINLTTL